MLGHAQVAPRFALAALIGVVLAGCGGGKTSDMGVRVTPDSGPLQGGNQVTITAPLTFEAGATASFDGLSASVVSFSGSSLVCVVPAGRAALKVDVVVTASGATSATARATKGYGYTPSTAQGSVAPGSTGSTAPVGTSSTAPVATGSTAPVSSTAPGSTPAAPGSLPLGNFAFLANTDKWWVVTDDLSMCDADQDGTPDLVQVLAFVRDTTGGQGLYASRLTDATTLIMSFTSQHYLNNPDGTRAVGGIPITFQRTRPPAGTSPGTGRQARPQTRQDYNVMAFQHLGGTSATTGRGLLDVGTSNANLENNSGRGASTGNALGSFPDREVDFWNRSGMASSQRTLENFCKCMAGTMAHEVGHSLGLDHTTVAPRAPAQVNIMSPVSTVDPTKLYAFDEVTIRNLIGYMPGALRCTHPAGWTPRWLVQESTAIVVATPRALADGRLTLDVHAVVSGQLSPSPTVIEGFNEGAPLAAADLAAIGRSVWFLDGGTEGHYRFGGAEAELLPLAGRSEAEWTALLADYRALRALETTDRAAWLTAYAARLERSLRSSDARIKNGALVELSLERDAARALSATAAGAVLAVAASPSAPDDARLMALRALTHRADPSLAARVLTLALSTDAPALLGAAAGVLESTLGLDVAATTVLASVETVRDPAARGRAVAVLGWLQAKDAVDLAVADLAGANARRAADAHGRIRSAAALPALEALAADASRDALTRQHALRAIGQIGTADAQAWLTARAAAGEQEAVFARDFSGSWTLAD